MTSTNERLSPRKLVRCWNCKHLKTVHQGESKDGRLFDEKVWRCGLHGAIFQKRLEAVRERECNDHVRVGLWKTPPEATLRMIHAH